MFAEIRRNSRTGIWLASWHTFGVSELKLLTTGKNSTLSSGTEHVRMPVPPEKKPARNHTGPGCPTMQFSPLISSKGLTDVEIERAHCHHSALSLEWTSES